VKTPRLLLVAFAVACAGRTAAENHEFLAAESWSASPKIPAATHRVPLQIVILRGSRWTWADVDRRVAKTREILAQCGVRLEPTIVELNSPSGSPSVLYQESSAQNPASLRVVAQTLAQSRPVLFYVESFSDNIAQRGTARIRTNSAGEPEVDTAWIPYFEPSNVQWSYQVDAHELVHVLADIGHWTPPYRSPPGRKKGDPPDPNAPDHGLMVGNPSVRTNVLAPFLCARIKSHPRAARL